jgi:hypothetical protein
MEGAGILTMLAMLLFAPFEMMRAGAQKRRLLTPHELNLRLATRPLGVAALVAWGVWLFGANNVGTLLAPVFLHPSDNWLPAVLLGAVLLYSLASFIVGASQCWGARSDRMLPVWAFFELAVGGGGLRFLWLWNLDLARALDVAPKIAALWLLLAAVSIWCGVVGAARFLLLTVGGGNALGLVQRHIQQTKIVMRPVRPRPWWKFW